MRMKINSFMYKSFWRNCLHTNKNKKTLSILSIYSIPSILYLSSILYHHIKPSQFQDRFCFCVCVNGGELHRG